MLGMSHVGILVAAAARFHIITQFPDEFDFLLHLRAILQQHIHARRHLLYCLLNTSPLCPSRSCALHPLSTAPNHSRVRVCVGGSARARAMNVRPLRNQTHHNIHEVVESFCKVEMGSANYFALHTLSSRFQKK